MYQRLSLVVFSVWRETRALTAALALASGEKPCALGAHGAPCAATWRGAPLTESDFCLRGPSPQNLHN